MTVFLQCRRSVLIVEARTPDAEVQMIQILLNRGPAVLDRDRLAEADEGCFQTPPDLDRASAELPDFIERQGQIILPCGDGVGDPDRAVRVAGVAGVKFSAPKPPQ